MNAKYTFDYWTRSTTRIIFNFLRGKQDLVLSIAPALWNCYGFIAIAWKHYLYYVFAGVFFCSALLKLVVPIKTPQTVVYTCCVLGHITDSWIVSRQPGAVVHDGRTEMQRLGASPCYHFLFGIILTCSLWSLYLSGIFQRLSACWCQQTSVINSLSCTQKLDSLAWILAQTLTEDL